MSEMFQGDVAGTAMMVFNERGGKKSTIIIRFVRLVKSTNFFSLV